MTQYSDPKPRKNTPRDECDKTKGSLFSDPPPVKMNEVDGSEASSELEYCLRRAFPPEAEKKLTSKGRTKRIVLVSLKLVVIAAFAVFIMIAMTVGKIVYGGLYVGIICICLIAAARRRRRMKPPGRWCS